MKIKIYYYGLEPKEIEDKEIWKVEVNEIGMLAAGENTVQVMADGQLSIVPAASNSILVSKIGL